MKKITHPQTLPVFPVSRSARLQGSTASLTMTTADVAGDYASYYSPASAGDGFNASTSLAVEVTNTGGEDGMASGVVVQVFARLTSPPPPGSSAAVALRQLAGFARAPDVLVGATRLVVVGIAPLALARVDAGGNQWSEPGEWALSATVDGATFLQAKLTITGPRQQVLSWPDPSEYQ